MGHAYDETAKIERKLHNIEAIASIRPKRYLICPLVNDHILHYTSQTPRMQFEITADIDDSLRSQHMQREDLLSQQKDDFPVHIWDFVLVAFVIWDSARPWVVCPRAIDHSSSFEA